MPEKRNLSDFEAFAKRTTKVRAPQDEKSYKSRYGRIYSSVSSDGYTKEEINEILERGNVEAVRELSRYFRRFSGEYARLIQYYSTLLSYSYMIMPHYDVDKPPKKLPFIYKKYARYIKDLNFSAVLPKINQKILEDGIYFGLLKETEKGMPVFYQLPTKYCRTRFNDEWGLPILELNLSYFDQIAYTEQEKKAILKIFPSSVQGLYRSRRRTEDWWAEILPSEGGMCFFFSEDHMPPFVSASGALADLQGAREREVQRDANELQKLLVQRLPIDKQDGELLFSLEEAKILHDSVSSMFASNENINVMTTYADIALEEIQDGDDAASASSSRLSKYKNSLYDEFGAPQGIFNAESGSTAITYSIKKDIQIMFSWSKQYEIWANAWLRSKAKNDSLYFTITFLPTSFIFHKEDIDTYLKIAQYGYPKAALAATLNLDASELIGISDFENNILHLSDYMLPLSSSYTQSGTEKNSKNSEKNSQGVTSLKDLSNEGGRPALETTQRSDKTSENLDGAT